MRDARRGSKVVWMILGLCSMSCGQGAEPTDPTDPVVDDGSSGGDTGGDTGGSTDTSRFSFFVTSLESMRELSGSTNGFGGDLRYGEATGLEGADKICRTLAEKSLAGAGQKVWRVFLSTSSGGASGGAVNAINRIGEGPWYDRNGRLVATNKAALVATRPASDARIANDLPNEWGVPNHQGVDNHDTLTGSNKQGQYVGSKSGTCNDWTSSVASAGKPNIGHSWPRNVGSSNGAHWISDHTAPGCAAGVNLANNGPGSGSSVGGGGGYGGLYCFALTP